MQRCLLAAALWLLGTTAGAAVVPVCSYDVDRNGKSASLTDGILIVRYVDGLRGRNLTAGAVARDAQRRKPSKIIRYLNGCRAAMLDPDGNGVAQRNDANIILRYLFGFRGTLLSELAAADCVRCQASDIENYLQQFSQ